MTKQEFDRNTEAVVAALSAGNLTSILQLTQERGHQTSRLALPAAPRCQSSLGNRISRAAQSIAELEFWNASGGDFLSSSRASDFIRAFQARFS